jgi:hypothetical protein
MAQTKNRLQEIESILNEGNAPVLKYLNPGVSRQELLTFFNEQNINPNPALLALYEWHNGINFSVSGMVQSMIEIIPMGIFYSLDFMVMSRKDVIEWNYMEDATDYIPLFGSGEDDIYLLKNSTGEIFYMSPAVQNFGEFVFRSIDTMLDFIIECYREKIITLDPVKGVQAQDYVVYYTKLENYNRL